MNVLIIGGTGTVGSQVATLLVKQEVKVKVLTRNPHVSNRLPDTVSLISGDLELPNTLGEAYDQVDVMLLINALSPTETTQGLAAVEAAKKAGIKKIVYLSVPMSEDSKHIPHFKSKIPVEEAIRQSGASYTILRPNNFFQNDYWYREALLNYRIYPQPIGSVGLNRVDVRDITDAAVHAILQDGFAGKEYMICGPDPLTGNATAELYSRIIGEEIRYGGDNLDVWFEQAQSVLPDWMAQDFKIMYQYFQDQGCLATERDFELQREILQREPRSFEAFVIETVAHWKIS